MKKWILMLLKYLPVKEILEIFVDFLEEQAKKTENQLDDQAILIIKRIIENAFGEK